MNLAVAHSLYGLFGLGAIAPTFDAALARVAGYSPELADLLRRTFAPPRSRADVAKVARSIASDLLPSLARDTAAAIATVRSSIGLFMTPSTRQAAEAALDALEGFARRLGIVADALVGGPSVQGLAPIWENLAATQGGDVPVELLPEYGHALANLTADLLDAADRLARIADDLRGVEQLSTVAGMVGALVEKVTRGLVGIAASVVKGVIKGAVPVVTAAVPWWLWVGGALLGGLVLLGRFAPRHNRRRR